MTARRLSAPLLGAAFLLCAPLPLAAQTLDCTAPVTQVEMTGCASRAYEASDAALNTAYQAAMALARSRPAPPEGLPDDASLLRDAQRAWIPFRDAACTAESTLARGGTMQNMIFYQCLDRLTRQRIEDLTLYSGPT